MRPSDWQPIENPPPKEAVVLGYGRIAGEIGGVLYDNYVAEITRCRGTDYPGFDWEVRTATGYTTWMRPTHWMYIRPP